jgi:hypothetical protein
MATNHWVVQLVHSITPVASVPELDPLTCTTSPPQAPQVTGSP